MRGAVEVRRILCFGDSNTWGTRPEGGRFPKSLRWPGVLQQALGGRVSVLADGVPGRTTALSDPDQPGRNGLEALPGALDATAPVDLLVLMLGTNDLKRVFQRSPEQVASGMEGLVRVALRSAAGPGGAAPEVLVVAPPPFDEAVTGALFRGRGWAAERLAEEYRTLARRLRVHFFDAATAALPSRVDGVHLDAEGHARLGYALAQWVEQNGWTGNEPRSV